MLLFFICWSTHLSASTSNTTSVNESPLPACSGQIQVFEDVSGTMTLAHINALYAESPLSFATAQQKRLKLGFTHSAWWLRVELSNHAATNVALVLALLDVRLDTCRLLYQPYRCGVPACFITLPADRNSRSRQRERLPVFIRVVSVIPRFTLEPALYSSAAFVALEKRDAL